MYIINLFYLHLQLNCRSDNRHLSSHRFFRHRSFPTDHALACYHRLSIDWNLSNHAPPLIFTVESTPPLSPL